MVLLLLIFKLLLGCFSLSSRLFRYQIASGSCCVCVCVSTFNFVFLFILSLFCECSIVTCICVFEIFNVNSAGSLDEPCRANVVINSVYKLNKGLFKK